MQIINNKKKKIKQKISHDCFYKSLITLSEFLIQRCKFCLIEKNDQELDINITDCTKVNCVSK